MEHNQTRKTVKEVLTLVQSELTEFGPENGVGYTLPNGNYHIFVYLDVVDDEAVYVVEPNRVDDGAHEPIGGDTHIARRADLAGLMFGCLWCLDVFDMDQQNPECVWITVYKDTLGYCDEEDNLAEIQVPKQWLKDVLKAEGQSPYEQWENEYTADHTDGIVARALAEKVIQGCNGIDMLENGAKVEWHHDLYEVVGVYDGLVYLQNVNNDDHAEIAVERFLKDAELVSEAQISRSSLDEQIAAAAVGGTALADNVQPGRDFERD